MVLLEATSAWGMGNLCLATSLEESGGPVVSAVVMGVWNEETGTPGLLGILEQSGFLVELEEVGRGWGFRAPRAGVEQGTAGVPWVHTRVSGAHCL